MSIYAPTIIISSIKSTTSTINLRAVMALILFIGISLIHCYLLLGSQTETKYFLSPCIWKYLYPTSSPPKKHENAEVLGFRGEMSLGSIKVISLYGEVVLFVLWFGLMIRELEGLLGFQVRINTYLYVLYRKISKDILSL